jgi:hypothetical protein
MLSLITVGGLIQPPLDIQDITGSVILGCLFILKKL